MGQPQVNIILCDTSCPYGLMSDVHENMVAQVWLQYEQYDATVDCSLELHRLRIQKRVFNVFVFDVHSINCYRETSPVI